MTIGDGLPLTRRAIVTGLSGLVAAHSSGAWAEPLVRPDVRIVSLNWAISETLYAMQVRPIGAAEITGYDEMVGYPPTPSGIVDVGFQSDPNLELLSSLAPNIVLIQSWQSGLRSIIERFSRVESFTLYARGGDPFARAREATLQIAEIAERPSMGVDLIDHIDRRLERYRVRLSAYDRRPIYLVQALTPTNLVVFTTGSLFDEVMRRLGLANAWSAPPDLLWGSTHIGVDALSTDPEARIIWIASPDHGASEGLFRSALWQSLPQVRAGRIGHLPMVWGFGGLPTAERFGGLLTSLLVEDGGA
ncbi:ABC transporter substrate-binding protein [Methylocapsa sp. S129]|uniref:ABC transporter substrate-binding protein n=1 Tax=Methylocapsa sp. S129 TaxID=1641869 RepID=UPI00131C207D|nr:ABC transporter substrate-binding protein [Methylocapsa sp. S129]